MVVAMKLPAVPTNRDGVSKRNCAVAKPAFALRATARFTLPFIPAVPLSAGQGIQAKANKTSFLSNFSTGPDLVKHESAKIDQNW